MKKNWKYILIPVVVLVVLLIIAYAKNKKLPQSPAGGNTGLSQLPPSIFPLKLGSEGDEVQKVQYAINKMGRPYGLRLNPDGIWGSGTEAAVKRISMAWFGYEKTIIDRKDYASIISIAKV